MLGRFSRYFQKRTNPPHGVFDDQRAVNTAMAEKIETQRTLRARRILIRVLSALQSVRMFSRREPFVLFVLFVAKRLAASDEQVSHKGHKGHKETKERESRISLAAMLLVLVELKKNRG